MRFIHAFWSQKWEEDTKRRIAFARSTWDKVYSSSNWNWIAITENDLPDLCSDERLPKIRDIFDFASSGISESSLIVFTNSDLCTSSNLEKLLPSSGMAYSHRHDVPSIINEAIPDSDIGTYQKYPGVDLFAIDTELWKTIRKDYPDMLLGREAWDAVMMELCLENNAIEIPCAVYHESHNAFWCRPENILTLPGQKWNRQIASDWMLKRGINPSKYNI